MTYKMCKYFLSVFFGSAGQTRFYGILGLALVMTVSLSAAYAQVTPLTGHVGHAYGNSDDDGENYNDVLTDNMLIIDIDLDGSAYGTYDDVGEEVTNNSVFINDGSVSENVYGGYSDGGSATHNSVTMNAGTIGDGSNVAGETGNVFGGYVLGGDGNVAFNNVTLNAGTVETSVFGGYIENGNGAVTNNGVLINDGSVNENVFGGFSDGGPVTHNSVTLNGGTIGDGFDATGETGNVFGGYVLGGDGNVAFNNVTLNAGTVETSVFGGYIENGDGAVTNNSVFLHGGGVLNQVYGGWTDGSGVAMRNSVTVSDGTIGDGPDTAIYGGWSTGGAAMENRVSFLGGEAYGIYGGQSVLDDAVNNSVFVSGGTVFSVFAGKTRDGIAENNLVVISEDARVEGEVYGGYSELGSNARGNIVTIERGTLGNGTTADSGNVFGGFSQDGMVTGNMVTIHGGTVVASVSSSNDDSTGNIVGGYSIDNNATGNSVFIHGGKVIVGGDGGGSIFGGRSDSGSATGNTVVISGSPDLADSRIYGAYISSAASDGDATGNTVTLSGTPNLSASDIYGGFSHGSGDVFTGNTLNVHTGGLLVKSVQNFEYMNFYVPTTMGDGGVMLTATESANIEGTVVNVVIEGSRSPLKTGDHIVLMEILTSGGLQGPADNKTANGRGMHGVTLLYDFDVFTPDSHSDQLWAQLNTVVANPQTQVFTDGFLAGGMLLNQTGDRIAGNGLNSAVHAAWRECNCGWGTFGDLSGGWSSYHTGTNVDLNSLSVIAGVSRCAGTASNRLTGGLFVEYGNGSYDSTRSFYNFAPVKSNGSLDHVGGGVLARWDFGYAMSRFYIDGSFRIGNLHNKFSSDLRDMLDTPAGFNANSAYYGAHIGCGKTWHFTNNAFDLYGKYLWSQMRGDSVLLTTGNPLVFESVNLHRLRFGGRFNVAMNSRITPYLGAAWEHEFGGTSCASSYGYGIPESSLGGGTGIGELGIALKPASRRGFFFDLGIQAYTGKRDGVTAAIFAGRNF